MEAFILLIHTVWQIYIYWTCVLSILDAVCKFDGEDDFWLFTFSWKHEHHTTQKLPQFLFSLTQLMSFSVYANVSSSEDCQQEGILGNGSLWFCLAALNVLHPQCEYETLTNWQPTAWIFTKLFWTWRSVNSADVHLCWCHEAFMWCLSS